MSDRLLAATRKGLFTIKRTAGKWSVANAAFVGDRVSLALVDRRDGTWYAALDHGHFGVKLHRSEDAGQNWTEVSAPAFPDKPEGLEDKMGDGRDIPWNTILIWSLEPGGADRDGALWAGTIPGGLFKSPDRGESWALVESLWRHEGRQHWFGGGADYPGLHSISVHPDDSSRVIAGVSCGGVWETTDDGETWNVRAEGMRAEFMPPDRANDPYIQDPHCIVRCKSAPDALWCQHHNGIFKSTDGAASWQEIEGVSPSTFGFATAVHPDDPNTAWFVPGKSDQHRFPVDGQVVVNRTRDGGETFETLREGLPQRHAYDLTYRHALDIDDSGDRLAFGSTTGSLWVTENQGDSWTAVTHHLPPVFAVRFA